MATRQTVFQIFPDSDMRLGHPGLKIFALKRDVDVTKLKPGSHAVFINSKCNRIKFFSANNVVSYYMTETGRRIDMRALHYIPKSFDPSSELDMDKATKKMLVDRLGLKEAVDE